MVLWAQVNANNELVASIAIRRTTPGKPRSDDVNEYETEVVFNGRVSQTVVEHRYGDGALVLMRKALEALT